MLESSSCIEQSGFAPTNGAGTKADHAVTILRDKDSRAAKGLGITKDFAPHRSPRFDGRSRQHLARNDAGVRLVPRGDVQSGERGGIGLGRLA